VKYFKSARTIRYQKLDVGRWKLEKSDYWLIDNKFFNHWTTEHWALSTGHWARNRAFTSH